MERVLPGAAMTQAARAVASEARHDYRTVGVAGAVQDALKSPGRPLDAGERRHLESYFQHDFSQVAIHSDERGAASARMLDAQAYTLGDHVVFGAGQYQPGTAAGQSLLAHELAHVKQQSRRRREEGGSLDVEAPDAIAEQQAAGAALGLALGAHRAALSIETPLPGIDRLQRQPPAAPSIPTTGGITLTIDERGRVDVTISGPSTTPIVSRPTIGIRRDPDGKHYHILVGGRDSVVPLDQIPEMLRSLGGAGPRAAPGKGARFTVPACDQLTAMHNSYDNYRVSQMISPGAAGPEPQLPLTQPLFDALVAACSPQPAKPPTGPANVPETVRVPPLIAGLLGSETLDNFVFDDATPTKKHVDEIRNHLAPRLKALIPQYPLATIEVTGHADEIGSDDYNRGLAQRRANSVRDELIADGVPAAAIATQSAGKTHPVIATGKREGRNRRVEIRFSAGLSIPGLRPEPPSPAPVPAQGGSKPPSTQPGTPSPGNQPGTPPPRRRSLVPPDPLRGIPSSAASTSEEGPHAGIDVAADAGSVTLTLVYKDLRLATTKKGAVIDWFGDPSLSSQFSGGKPPDSVVQAAIAAINIHLRRHGEDLVELSLSPQVGVSTGTGQPSVGAQAQAELHVTATFSFTASSTVTAKKSADVGKRADVEWQYFMVGVLYHVGAEKEKAKPPKQRETVDNTFPWLLSQFDATTLDDGAAEGNLKEGADEIVRRMLTGMIEAAGKDVARVELDLGRHAQPLPPRLEEGLAQLARLIKFSHPSLESLTHVQVPVLLQPPGSKETKVFRFFDLDVRPQPGAPGSDVVPRPGRRPG